MLELGPLDRDELTALLAARADAPPPAAVTDAIVARSEGNPFFAEELSLPPGAERGELPRGLRELLLAARGRARPLRRRACCAWRRPPDATSDIRCSAQQRGFRSDELRESLRLAVEHGVLVAEPATGSFRFRHALLAEAIYATILPGEREELHAGSPTSSRAAELRRRPSSRRTGRRRVAATEALAASVEAARQAEAVFGLAEAHAHLERALALWDAVPDAAELAGLDLAELCARTAELAGEVGAAPRAVELGRQAIELVGGSDPHRAALLHVRLGEYLEQTGSEDACLAAVERAVELVPAEPPSPERAYALASLAGALCVAWRHAESLPICRTGARARSGGRRTRGGGPSAHGARRRPRLPRPRRGGCRRSSSGAAARRGDRRSHRPRPSMYVNSPTC